MNELTLTTATTSYPVIVEAGALATLPQQLERLGLRGTCWLISDSNVLPRYGAAVAEPLRAAGYRVQSMAVPAGESSKCLAVLEQLYGWMLGGGVERRDVVLALGGGVVGDLAGFAAASVLRGINLVQLPTTLLAMVDSAIGGKTGINHPLGKNLIGAFHQPRMVLADTNTLATLPPRELAAGWAETIKHGMIRDAALFATLENQEPRTENQSERTVLGSWFSVLSNVVRRSAAVKVAVVSADEFEQGERIILNYGHTLGHAVEAASLHRAESTPGYEALLHGEAVAIGMHAEARLAAALGLCDDGLVQRQHTLLQTYGLPTAIPPDLDRDEILALTLRDKKVQNKRIRWVLPTAVGSVVIHNDVPQELVQAIVAQNE
ncbi:MAG: 3-dehydroquinate synthase [Chloroflexaceae bacterium]|jgi:3-dehydroquinate synthase|nr:3-dehydroquinate synthase [Chloroflexaceae bacterium]